jgi:hypothetical protein
VLSKLLLSKILIFDVISDFLNSAIAISQVVLQSCYLIISGIKSALSCATVSMRVLSWAVSAIPFNDSFSAASLSRRNRGLSMLQLQRTAKRRR